MFIIELYNFTYTIRSTFIHATLDSEIFLENPEIKKVIEVQKLKHTVGVSMNECASNGKSEVITLSYILKIVPILFDSRVCKMDQTSQAEFIRLVLGEKQTFYFC